MSCVELLSIIVSSTTVAFGVVVGICTYVSMNDSVKVDIAKRCDYVISLSASVSVITVPLVGYLIPTTLWLSALLFYIGCPAKE
jgi:hypothetical protein